MYVYKNKKDKGVIMEKGISVIIPAFNEETNIEVVIKTTQKSEYVEEVIVVDNLSTDRTEEISLKEGAKVVKCNMQGKGYAMEKGVEVAKSDIIVFLDADIPCYSEDVVHLLAKPIIENDVDFVKSTFDREGGRVTELVAKPVLKLLFPELQYISQPLSGMIAGKREIFEKLVFEKDYGVDIGILLDVANMECKMEQVDIGRVENNSKDWKLLDKMSTEVMRAILKRKKLLI